MLSIACLFSVVVARCAALGNELNDMHQSRRLDDARLWHSRVLLDYDTHHTFMAAEFASFHLYHGLQD